jgi:serine/threonine protein kinase
MFKVAKALNFIRKRNIIHRDLKLENILLDENFNCKISDFGWACQNFDGKRQTICGTVDYLSPEVSDNLHYDFGVDVWSLGVMAYELMTGSSPFSGKDTNETMENIKNIKIDLNNDAKLKNSNVSNELILLLEKVYRYSKLDFCQK